MSETAVPLEPETERVHKRRDYSQLFVSVVLVVVGVTVLISAAGLRHDFATVDPLGPQFFPTIVGIILLLLAVWLTVSIFLGSRAEEEEGEDVDLNVRADWWLVGKLVLVLALNVALVDTLGWVITGALLFAGAAWVLGSRRHFLNIALGLAFSLLSFYGFNLGLNIEIPAGILNGIL